MIIVKPYNESFVQIEAEYSQLLEISDYFTFMAQNYKFHPKFKKGMWDGKIRLFNVKDRLFPKGLIFRLYQFASERKHEIDIKEKSSGEKITTEIANQFIESLSLPPKIKPRDYQIETLIKAIRLKRAVFLSPTSSGKSLMIYMIARFLKMKTLIIVPDTGLLAQIYQDFTNYSASDDEWDASDNCYLISAGVDKVNLTKDIVICVRNSISNIKDKVSWLKQFDLIINDECHLAKAKELTGIMNSAIETEYRYGFTGTFDNVQCNQIMIEGLFGPTQIVTTQKELIKRKQTSDLKINMITLEYSEEDRKKASFLDYDKSSKYICLHDKRTEFLVKLATSLKGNTLILFKYIDIQGKVLYDLIKDIKGEDKTFFVDGSVKGEDRIKLREVNNSSDGVVNVCSYGTFSTGVSIDKLDNLIFAFPSRGQIRVLQSIGRVLRLHESKEYANIWDIVDNLDYQEKRSIFMNHASIRHKIYKENLTNNIHFSKVKLGK